MKKTIILLTALIAFAAFRLPEDTWTGDKAHSELGFCITHLGISEVTGTFNDFDVTVTSAKPDFSDAVFELTANVASIDTRVEMRDGHLKSPDFFDVAKFPTMTFKSTSIKKNGSNKYKLGGNLTLHGITKPVTLDVMYKGSAINPESKANFAGFQLTGIIKRTDYNVGPGYPPPGLGNEVTIKASGEFKKNKMNTNNLFN